MKPEASGVSAGPQGTGKVRGPVVDALDEDIERIEVEPDEERGKAGTGEAQPPAAQAKFDGFCKLILVNNADATLVRATTHLDNDKAHFGAEPPPALSAGRSAPFFVSSRDPQHPEIGGFVDYTFRIDPPPADNPSGEFTLRAHRHGAERHRRDRGDGPPGRGGARPHRRDGRPREPAAEGGIYARLWAHQSRGFLGEELDDAEGVAA